MPNFERVQRQAGSALADLGKLSEKGFKVFKSI
jgi:hypothetical protein